MSLDIIAYDPKETKARKNKFKAKYGISYDKFDDEMIKPRKDMFCYYLHPELLESDIKEYEEMDDDAELIADVDEVDSFHIGYGQFNFLRKELGELVGIRYDDSDVFNTRIYYDDCYKNTSLLNFFLHSDCDGDFSTDEIQESYEQFTKYCDKEMLREKKAGKWAEEINGFLKFWRKDKGYSQQDLACLLKVSTHTLSDLENGYKQPTKLIIDRFSYYMNLLEWSKK